MRKNVSGEVSVTWGEKSFTKPLSGALIQLALIVLVSVIFTAVIGFIFLGLSIAGIVTLIVLSASGLGAAAYFGRDFLVGIIFKDGKQAPQAPVETQAAENATEAKTEI